MDDYIKRRALLDAIENLDWYRPIGDGQLLIGATGEDEAVYKANDVFRVIESLPTADVAPARHGHWIDARISGVAHYRCTECGEYIESVWTANFDYHYCPNCGARMDKSGTQPQRADEGN